MKNTSYLFKTFAQLGEEFTDGYIKGSIGTFTILMLMYGGKVLVESIKEAKKEIIEAKES